VTRAARADVDFLLDLYEDVAAERMWIGGEPPLPDRAERRARLVADYFESGDGLLYVARYGGRPVGMASLEGRGAARLGMLVSSEMRGRGVGSALLEACIGGAAQLGAHKITLQLWPHNERARRLYEKFGFEEEGYLRAHYRRRNGELWDAVVMGLLLGDSRPARRANEAHR
jgi:RimJ/RimL family protein N-acetyltransferase